jgi:hypothetical protein
LLHGPVGILHLPCILAAVLSWTSNDFPIIAFGHVPNLAPIFHTHVIVYCDGTWMQTVASVLFAPGNPVSDLSLDIEIIAFETGPVARFEGLAAVVNGLTGL